MKANAARDLHREASEALRKAEDDYKDAVYMENNFPGGASEAAVKRAERAVEDALVRVRRIERRL